VSQVEPSRRVSAVTWQRCARCGREYPELDPRMRCADCGGLLEVRHAPPSERGAALRERFRARLGLAPGRAASGVWRYREMVLPAVGGGVVTQGEGNTPLLTHAAVARWAGADELLLKHEGHNPTGSFKDRGMTVGVTQATRLRASAVACASTGNTSASLAAYAAYAGLPALVVVPAGRIALGKLAQSLAYGARTFLVRGDFDASLRLVQEASEQLGVYLLNSINPFRIEGQKTIMLEMLHQLDWEPPDWVVLPAGNLGNTAAFGKALCEARELGLIGRLPRLAAVQAEGAAPFARSFREGFASRYTVTAETAATAIRIGDPASYDRAVESILNTDGVVTSVSDDEIFEAKRVIDAAGIGCEPASAASVAGARRLIAEGVIKRGERLVAILTGHLLKDAAAHPESADNRPIEIDASLAELARHLEK
jgi:threonine synthase